MKKLLLLITLIITSCTPREIPTQFSPEALNDNFIALDGSEITFKEILNQYKGRKVVIDIWASWCGDCIRGMPKVVNLQKENPDAVYLFLSLDGNTEAWKTGIHKYHVNGEHYFIKNGKKGSFGSFVDIDWIPRYMVIDELGNIAVFKTVHADDVRITNSLKK